MSRSLNPATHPSTQRAVSISALPQKYAPNDLDPPSDELSAILAARSQDAIARSRALLARTRNMLGMQGLGKRARK